MRSTTTPKYKLPQRLVYYYFCVRSEFFKCYTFSKRQVISWQWPLRTLLCPELKHKLSVKARLNPSSGKDALTMFSLWEKGRETTNQFVLEANTHHPTIKCVCFKKGFFRPLFCLFLPFCFETWRDGNVMLTQLVYILDRK